MVFEEGVEEGGPEDGGEEADEEVGGCLGEEESYS